MAKITPYDPGDMPNRLVGTPGVDPSAGKALQALAQGANQIRNEDNQLANQNAGFLGSVIGKVGQEVGKVIGAHEAAKAAQQKQIATAQMASDGFNYGQSAHSTFDDYLEKYKDNPENLVPAMQQYLNDTKEQGLQKYENDPLRSAQMAAKYDEINASVMNKASEKSHEMQYAQATAMVPNMITKAGQEISSKDG